MSDNAIEAGGCAPPVIVTTPTAASGAGVFLRDLQAVMQQHGVDSLSYTIDDDGIHAHRHEGDSWHLGWVEAARTLDAQQEGGVGYGIIDPDYARIFTIARVLAWSEGYALTMHGSFTRDLDLVAVPWTDNAREPAHLARRILETCGLKDTASNPGLKPHGRQVWTMRLPDFGDPRFVDFSVMPLAAAPINQQDSGEAA